MKRKVTDLRPHPDNSRIYTGTNSGADDELRQSIERDGLLEPIGITRDGLVLSGHRRLRAVTTLGWSEVECRVLRPTNEIVALISFNKHRTKTPAEIVAEANYLAREIQKRVGRGRNATKTRDGKKTNTLDELASTIGVKKGNLRWLQFIEKKRPDLIPKIGNELTLEQAKRLVRVKKSTPVRDDSTNPFQQDLLNLLRKHTATYDETVQVLRRHPPFVCQFTDTSGTEVKQLYDHLVALSRLSAEDLLLVRKWDTIHNTGFSRQNDVDGLVPKWNEISEWMESATGVDDVVIHEVSGKRKTVYSPSMYEYLRVTLASTPYKAGPGNESKFLVGFNRRGKFRLLGTLRLHSDFARMKGRDDHIGWNEQVRATKREFIVNLMDCIPVRGFGANALGGKFLTLLSTHPLISGVYEKNTGRSVVGITVTSLYGLKNSQYHGLEKWNVRSVGETTGQQLLVPLSWMWDKWSRWLSDNYPSEVRDILTTDSDSVVTGPLQRKLHLLYKLLGFPTRQLYEQHRRGVFFVDRFVGGRDWLKRPTVNESTLPVKVPTLETATWFSWWKTKALVRMNELVRNGNLDTESFSYGETQPTVVRRLLTTKGYPTGTLDVLFD